MRIDCCKCGLQFNYSSLTLNQAESAVFVTDGGKITDPLIFGGGNFIQVNGLNFWDGRLFNSFGGASNPATIAIVLLPLGRLARLCPSTILCRRAYQL